MLDAQDVDLDKLVRDALMPHANTCLYIREQEASVWTNEFVNTIARMRNRKFQVRSNSFSNASRLKAQRLVVR